MKRGRPSLWDERGAYIGFRAPASLYVQVAMIARQESLPVSAVLRAAVRAFVKRRDCHEPPTHDKT